MKVTPLAGPAMGSVSSPSTEVRDRAKQAYLGDSQTKITPVEKEREERPDVKRIKMKTNFSTNREEQEILPEATQESATGETSVEASPESEVTRPISPQLAELAKQKRALQVKERELLAKEKAMSEASGNAIDLAKIKANPLSILQQAGVSYDDLTQAILSDNSTSPDLQALKDEVKQVRDEFKKEFQTREQAQEEAVLKEILFEAEELAKAGDDYELIRGENGYEKVLRKIYDTYKKTGRVLDTREAMTAVEQELRTQTDRYLNYGYVKSKLAPQATPAAQNNNQLRTLSNRDSASPLVDKRARAIAAMQGRLKK
jgi:hypothetical protein